MPGKARHRLNPICSQRAKLVRNQPILLSTRDLCHFLCHSLQENNKYTKIIVVLRSATVSKIIAGSYNATLLMHNNLSMPVHLLQIDAAFVATPCYELNIG